MNNADFWASVNAVIDEGFMPEGLRKLTCMQRTLSVEGLYINDFHRSNSMAAQREVLQMSLQPYSREQKLAQIAMLKMQSQSSKENANAERSRKQG